MLCAVLAAGCAANPASLQVSAEAGEALILLYVPQSNDFTLHLARYDPVARDTTVDLVSGRAALTVPLGHDSQFVYQTVKAGTYAFLSFERQFGYALCFQSGTLAFTAAPGDVLLIGTIAPERHFAELGRNIAANNDHLKAKGLLYHYFDNISPPQIVQSQSPGTSVADAQAFVAANFPKVKGAAKLAVLQKASFTAGKSVWGDRVCGSLIKDK